MTELLPNNVSRIWQEGVPSDRIWLNEAGNFEYFLVGMFFYIKKCLKF